MTAGDDANGNPTGPSWWVHVAWIAGGILSGLSAFAVAYWWFSNHGNPGDQYDIVRSAIAATGVITVGAGAAVALRRQKTNEDEAARANAAHLRAERAHELAQDNMALTRRGVEASLKKLSLEEDANRTDRYTRAVEQLGSGSIHIRLGGIYALKRLADDSERDLPTIVEVLAAFIRATTAELEVADQRKNADWTPAYEGESVPHSAPGIDVQAAVTALSHINKSKNTPIDLSRAYLPGANFCDSHFQGASFFLADLRFARFDHAVIDGADLNTADLSQSIMIGASLIGVNLSTAQLEYAQLNGANLAEADLMEANLDKADLTEANLTDAILVNAYLNGTILDGANLTAAVFASTNLASASVSQIIWEMTTWPEDFVPPPSRS